MFRIITIEREYGCGGGAIADKLARQLGWNLWDHRLTEEIASVANVNCADVERQGEKLDSRFYRLAKTFWRGSYERSINLEDSQTFDADCMVATMEKISARIAREGNAVVVGRGAPFFLRDREDTFHVFLYAPRAEKIRRIVADGGTHRDAENLVETVDRERIAFIKHYFNADWPTRALYHMMLNTMVGDDNIIATILEGMRRIEERSAAQKLRGVR